MESCVFENQSMEEIRIFLVNKAYEVTNRDALKVLLLSENLGSKVDIIFKSDLLKPLKINDENVAFELFDATYKMFIKSDLEKKSGIISQQCISIMNELKLIEGKISECNDDEEKEFLVLEKEFKNSKIYALNNYMKEIRARFLQIK